MKLRRYIFEKRAAKYKGISYDMVPDPGFGSIGYNSDRITIDEDFISNMFGTISPMDLSDRCVFYLDKYSGFSLNFDFIIRSRVDETSYPNTKICEVKPELASTSRFPNTNSKIQYVTSSKYGIQGGGAWNKTQFKEATEVPHELIIEVSLSHIHPSLIMIKGLWGRFTSNTPAMWEMGLRRGEYYEIVDEKPKSFFRSKKAKVKLKNGSFLLVDYDLFDEIITESLSPKYIEDVSDAVEDIKKYLTKAKFDITCDFDKSKIRVDRHSGSYNYGGSKSWFLKATKKINPMKESRIHNFKEFYK